MALVRRKVAQAPVEIPAKSGPRKKRTIPIKDVSKPTARPVSDKAYVPPEGAAESGGSGTDYAAVVERYRGRVKNPMTAIRYRCIQCCNGQVKEVTLCPTETCGLHPFRMGVNPLHKRRKDRLAREGDDADDAGDDE